MTTSLCSPLAALLPARVQDVEARCEAILPDVVKVTRALKSVPCDAWTCARWMPRCLLGLTNPASGQPRAIDHPSTIAIYATKCPINPGSDPPHLLSCALTMTSRLVSSSTYLSVRQQLKLPAQRAFARPRYLNTVSAPPPKRRLVRALALATTAALAGTVGYALAQESQSDHRSSYRRRAADLPNNYGSDEDFRRGIAELRAHFTEPGTFSTDPDALHAHGFSLNSYHDGAPHSVVVFPQSTDDVVWVMKVATRYKIPVIPYSGGTSLEGNFSGVSQNFTHTVLNTTPRGNRSYSTREGEYALICPK